MRYLVKLLARLRPSKPLTSVQQREKLDDLMSELNDRQAQRIAEQLRIERQIRGIRR